MFQRIFTLLTGCIVMLSYTCIMSLKQRKSQSDRVRSLLKSSQDLFHTQDLALLWEIENRATLYNTIRRYVERGVLTRIHKGFYSKKPLDQINPVELGIGYLHSFCYLSVEDILTKEGIISQDVPHITLISDTSEKFEINGYSYISRQMKDEYLFNESGIEQDNKIKKAVPSRAVADMLYYNPDYHFDSPSLINWDEVKKIKEEVGY